jgi:cobalt-precorrin 5A hydrolase / precorrin-3B C17-methyltransferase
MIENGPAFRRPPPGFGPPPTPSLPLADPRPAALAIGIGCGSGADPAEAVALLRATLAEAGLAGEDVVLVASIEAKAGEPAIRAAAEALGVRTCFFDAARLEAETPRLASPSEEIFRRTGCHGVAEGAALAAAGAGASLVVPKRRSGRVTLAVAMAPAGTEEAPGNDEAVETAEAAGTAGIVREETT